MTAFLCPKLATHGDTAHSHTYSCFTLGTAFRDKTAGRRETSVVLCKEGVKTPSCRQRGTYGRNFFVGHIRGLGKNLRGRIQAEQAITRRPLSFRSCTWRERDREPGRVAVAMMPPMCSAPLNLSRPDDQGDHQ
jgi:hypothetical protein